MWLNRCKFSWRFFWPRFALILLKGNGLRASNPALITSWSMGVPPTQQSPGLWPAGSRAQSRANFCTQRFGPFMALSIPPKLSLLCLLLSVQGLAWASHCCCEAQYRLGALEGALWVVQGCLSIALGLRFHHLHQVKSSRQSLVTLQVSVGPDLTDALSRPRYELCGSSERKHCWQITFHL